ncbi:MAG TPA: M23 family metallopeptidase [Thermoflexia bacterium]|nr:M23 family metallopeptidase [Thermoflexia bacterium]
MANDRGEEEMGMNTAGGDRSFLSLFKWAVLTATLAAAAYLGGSALAQRWIEPPHVSPSATQVPQQEVDWLAFDEPVDGTLDADTEDVWQFRGREGQSAVIEMWLHPGSGSDVEAELVVRLLAPDGTVLVQETGSVFLPPYVVQPHLPTNGLYSVQVSPASGVPGRYSLALTLSDALAPVPSGGTPPPGLTATALSGPIAAVADKFQWPSTRREISGWTFHDPRNPGHIGLDIAAAMWDPIVAVADGVVVFAEWGGGYGNLVILEHDDGWRSYYAHLTEIVAEAGQEVRQGELLGGAGTTGYSTGPHLHFELRYQGRPVDPHVYLP